MATNRKTGQKIQTYKHDTSIKYDADSLGGSKHALGNFAVGTSGNNEVGLVGANNAIVGELLTVAPDGYCNVVVAGEGLEFKMGTASGMTNGNQIVGATGDSVDGSTNGYAKNAGTDVDGRGIVTEVSGTAKNSIATVNFP